MSAVKSTVTLVQLRHLIALADTGSFSRAAQAVFLTQSALSRSIRALEEELRAPLFDRRGRHIELTAVGRAMLERARQLIVDTEELQALALQVRDSRQGLLRVGMSSGPGAMLMTPMLQQVSRERPDLRVEIARGSTALLVEALRARDLDVLVVDARSLRPAADLRVELVREMRGAFMVRRGHPLARRRRAIDFAALERYPIASTPLSDEVARLMVERYGSRAHPAQCVTLRCDEIPSLVEVARGSDTVLLSVRAAAPELVELTLSPPMDITARFGMVTLARRIQAPALSIVRTMLQERLRDGVAA